MILRRPNAPSRQLEQVSLFYRQLAIMLGAGVQLANALTSLSKQYGPNAAKLIDELHHRVATGYTLSSAMSACGPPFTPVDVGMIEAAERSGTLVPTLEKLAGLTERTVMLRKRVIAALTYPAIQFFCIISVLLFFVVAISPGDVGVFSPLGGQLPWPTRVLVTLSSLLKSPYFIILSLTLVILTVKLFVKRFRQSSRFRLWFDSWCLEIPVFGTLWRRAAAVRVTETLEGMLSCGVPMMTALTLTERVVANTAIRKRLESMRREISEGESVGQAMGRQDLFGQMVAAMVEIGEETGQLDAMLRLVARRLLEDVDMAIDAMVKLIEPMLLCIAGMGAAFVAVAALMPFMQLIANL